MTEFFYNGAAIADEMEEGQVAVELYAALQPAVGLIDSRISRLELTDLGRLLRSAGRS